MTGKNTSAAKARFLTALFGAAESRALPKERCPATLCRIILRLPVPARRRPYHALEHRDFRLLGSATLVSIIGTQMQNVGIDWHIYLLTHSPLALGAVGLVRVAPLLFFSIWGGVVADRYDRKRVQFTTQSVMALGALLLALATWTHRDALWLIYLLTALNAAALAFDGPARQSLVPRLVPADDLPGALSLNLTFLHVGMIAGLSFVAVLGALLALRTSGRPERTGETPERWLESLRTAARFLFSTPIIVWTMSLDFFATFFSGAISLLPIVADQLLHVGAAGYGWLRAAFGAGALVASFFTAVHPLPRKQGPILLWSVAAYGAATMVYGLSHNFLLTLAALACSGAADLVSTVVRQTLRQVLTPDALRGRITAMNMIFFLGGPQLGEAEAGFVASLFHPAALGAMVAIASGGAATLLLVGCVAAITPVVRRYTLRGAALSSKL